MSSPRKRSSIWNHFTEFEPKKAKCSYCTQTLSISSGNVGNLNRHLKNKHPTIPLSFDGLNSVSVKIENCTESIKTSSCLKKGVQAIKRSQIIDEQVVRMICKGYHSLRVADEPEFKKLMEIIVQNSGYVLPSKKMLSNTLIPKLYDETLEKVHERIDSAKAICITTDCWTCPPTGDNYVSVTGHYIDEDMEMCSFLLEPIRYDDETTSEYLTELLNDCFKRWDIDNKIVAIVSDNTDATNISEAIQLGGWHHINCFAYQINQIVKKALNQIVDITTKVRKIVKFYQCNAQAKSKLYEVEREMGLPELMLKQSVDTRWNSTYIMLMRFIEIKDAVMYTTAIVQKDLVLTSDELEIIEKCLSILKLFDVITTEISAEQSVLLSKVIIYCKMMTNHINNHLKNTAYPSTIRNLLKTLQQQINEQFSDIESSLLHSEATVLDPRFKKFGFLNVDKYEEAVQRLKQTVSLAVNSSGNDINETKISINSDTNDERKIVEEIQKIYENDFWSDFDNEVKRAIPQNCTQMATLEFEKYLREDLLDRKCDPLKWWYERKDIYPNIYNYIFTRLCNVATSVSCQCIFSKTGEILRTRRTQLKGERLMELVFLHHNL